MDKLLNDNEVLKMLRDHVSKASTRKAVCECNFNMACEDWLSYVEEKYQKTLTDHELEMLIAKFNEERSKYPQRFKK